mmetsp:Transcript_69003/g.200214  ORF Transcript_69003/g.200214 Transcript_69003/m.200214 type:complete len:213 (+) Transcript_69003:575-1213(+)
MPRSMMLPSFQSIMEIRFGATYSANACLLGVRPITSYLLQMRSYPISILHVAICRRWMMVLLSQPNLIFMTFCGILRSGNILRGGIQVEWCKERRARPKPPRQPNPHRPAPVAVYVPPKEDEEKEEKKAKEKPQRNEEWIMSGYGHDQLYVNAACLERYRGGEELPDFKALGKMQCERLEREGATKRTLGFVKHVFDLADENPRSSPIDFLL